MSTWLTDKQVVKSDTSGYSKQDHILLLSVFTLIDCFFITREKHEAISFSYLTPSSKHPMNVQSMSMLSTIYEKKIIMSYLKIGFILIK